MNASPDKVPSSAGYLLVDSTKCSGCYNCVLACSLVHDGKISLLPTRTVIVHEGAHYIAALILGVPIAHFT